MTNQRFDALCRRVSDGTATEAERLRFVENAIELRIALTEHIDRLDEWDRDCDVVGWVSGESRSGTPDDPHVWARAQAYERRQARQRS